MNKGETFPGEKYNLRWNSHKNSLINYLGNHLINEDFVDVTLACEGKYLKAHKLILSACSSYFNELFQVHKVDKPLIILNNVTFKQLKYVIDFIYKGEIKVLDSELDNILALGNTLKIKGLSNIQDKSFVNKEDNLKQKKSSHSATKSTNLNQKINENPQHTKPNTNLTPIIKMKQQQQTNFSPIESNSKTEFLKEVKDDAKPKRRKVMNKPEVPKDISDLQELSSTDKSETSKLQVDSACNSKEGEKTVEPIQKITVHPVSAFMIFANEWRKKLTVEHPDESTKQISVRLSNMWKSLSEETKDAFYEAASIENAKNKIKFIEIRKNR